MPNQPQRKPFLIFPRPATAGRTVRDPRRSTSIRLTPEQQEQRFAERWPQLEQSFQEANISQTIVGTIPEMVLVLEINGTLEGFSNAVRRTEGLSFLGEQFSDFIESNEHAYVRADDQAEEPTESRIFLTMQNESSLRELKRLWDIYKTRGTFPRNFTKYRDLFGQLTDIRFYGVQDRLYDTGFQDYYLFCQQTNQTNIRFEIELVYHSAERDRLPNGESKNQLSFNEISEKIRQTGGRVIPNSRVVLDEIEYHALIGEAPISIFDDISEDTSVELLKANQVLHFRPIGQTLIKHLTDEDEATFDITNTHLSLPTEPPVAALLDGLPLQNHAVLEGRLDVDDPDNFSEGYLAKYRCHGTAMASLIVNGDLEDPNERPIKHRLYVRPIMKGQPSGFRDGYEEVIPADVLPIDLINRAVRRMFVGTLDEPPVAPTVKIVNLSIGDLFRPFHFNISTWARLIDWLSYKYNILFLISAGNCTSDIALNISADDFQNLDPIDRQKHTIEAIISDNTNRKILSPSESINAITVGSSHCDKSSIANLYSSRLNLIDNQSLLSPVSRIGFGYRGAIKPEILLPGGRKLFRQLPFQTDRRKTSFKLEDNHTSSNPPGIRVPWPFPEGSTTNTVYQCGTSNSTALATRLSILLYDALIEINSANPIEKRISEDYFPVLIKALLVHSASWGDSKALLSEIVRNRPGVAHNTVKKHITPYMGYGIVDQEKILYCTDQRVVLLGWGSLTKRPNQDAHIYTFPLPAALEGVTLRKKLAVTLAWLSPVNWKTHKYRKAQLFFDNIETNTTELTNLEREEADYNISRRGTVQHDILIGESAEAYVNDGNLVIKINCKEDAFGLAIDERIKYGLAVTLEINEDLEIPIYEQVKQRLETQVRINRI